MTEVLFYVPFFPIKSFIFSVVYEYYKCVTRIFKPNDFLILEIFKTTTRNENSDSLPLKPSVPVMTKSYIQENKWCLISLETYYGLHKTASGKTS